MENKIKVTVEYEAPNTSKFDALIIQYNAAKQMADEAIAYYKSLADTAMEAKLQVILEEIETLEGYMRRIYEITKTDINLSFWPNRFGGRFDITFKPKDICPFRISLGGDRLYWHSKIGERIIAEWDKQLFFQQLEKDACLQLSKAIESEQARGQEHIKRLNSIINSEV